MPLRDLDYQIKALARFEEYLIELSEQKKKADKIAVLAAEDPDLDIPVPDFPTKTWEALNAVGNIPVSRKSIPYSARVDGIGRPVPNVVFKVPTGGGKTYLGVSALSQIFGRYLGRNTGFVLWIVPNEAIYAQTKKYLIDRRHPYRQMLDVLSGNRVKLMEKDTPLNARDVEGGLCVMLLMLQSANRQTRESLKMFQDRGDVHGFFPPEGDMEAHRRALEETSNLDAYGEAGEAGAFWPMVKDSLGNALRQVRPVVVMDEGHKAISELAFETLYGFNPCFVLELTATPKDVAARGGQNPCPARPANVLIEITGLDLDREGMIKMPLNLDPREGTDWRNALKVALEKLNELEKAARRHEADGGKYIRPILLVQVERTGSDQQDGRHIHALDVKEWFATTGLDDQEIAIKTADVNDLANPENQDLLAPTNRVRVIITKQALQEGWDCPFAYILCSLSASSNLSAMTQLIGRILRQPNAKKTEVALLDECYVITHHADTANVVQAIKTGLEKDGLGDLVKEIRTDISNGNGDGPRKINRREKFKHMEIFLPQVLHVDGGNTRILDYEQDVQFAIEWAEIDVTPLVEEIPQNLQSPDRQMHRIRLAENGDERFVDEIAGKTDEDVRFDPSYAVRMISDIVPNAWIAREIVGNLIAGLKARGFSDMKIGEASGLLVEELRKWLDQERDRMAENHFRQKVKAGHIQFRLRTDGLNWRMPLETYTFEPANADQVVGLDGGPLKRSLFSPVFKSDMNQAEREVAVYLDAEEALQWWHRNVARSQFSVQGWRRDKIYPDLIFALQRGTGAGEKGNRLVVLEMKGDQLDNPESKYKKGVLQLLSTAFDIDTTSRVGELELVVEDGTTVECDLVLMSEWRTRIPNEFLKA